MNTIASQTAPQVRGNGPLPNECRRYPRHQFSGTVHLHDGNGEEFRAVDISAGGVGVLSLRPLGVGQVVNVAFLGRSVVVRGITRFLREADTHRWHVGIQFYQPQPELVDVATSFKEARH